jgi:predicted SAM-dependent methyltransferase
MFHHGWINTDIINISGFAAENQYKFIPLDVRKPLTFKDNTVDLITSSHMLEHLTYDEGLCFLKECHRVMRSDAVMRIAVPDAELLTNYYKNNQLQMLDEINLVAAQNSSQSFKLWSFLFEGHKIAYDWNSLKQIGNEAGFRVERRYFNQGHPQIIKETMDFLPELSIYVEMTK